MTAVKSAFYHNPYTIYQENIPAIKEKRRAKVKKENLELAFICALLVFGNIIAILKSTSVSFGFFGFFLLGISAISLIGALWGKGLAIIKKWAQRILKTHTLKWHDKNCLKTKYGC